MSRCPLNHHNGRWANSAAVGRRRAYISPLSAPREVEQSLSRDPTGCWRQLVVCLEIRCVFCGSEPPSPSRGADSACWVEVVRARMEQPVVCRADATYVRLPLAISSAANLTE